MNEQQARVEAVRHWWHQAQDSLEAARRELEAGANAFAINRAYYALFYAVSALLLEEGYEFSKHAGVRAAFNREIIKAGRLDRTHGDLYNALFTDRQAGDYIAFTAFDLSDVRNKIAACEEFLVALRPLIHSLEETRDE